MPTLCPNEIPALTQSLETLYASIIEQVGGTFESHTEYNKVSVCVHKEKDSAVISIGDCIFKYLKLFTWK